VLLFGADNFLFSFSSVSADLRITMLYNYVIFKHFSKTLAYAQTKKRKNRHPNSLGYRRYLLTAFFSLASWNKFLTALILDF
jgi:hypothetical protein